jgi:ankyrin repeat protein
MKLLLTTIAAVLLVGCGPPPKDIWEAAEEGNVEAVKQHLAAGTDVNAKDMFGSTPLHGASTLGRKEIAELLIAKGADVNAEFDADGLTPLDLVFLFILNDKAAQKEMADLLRKHGGKTGEELKAEAK